MACASRNDACRTCAREDEDQRRRIKRDLKLEADRVAQQTRYAKELQEIQDELDHQRRILQYGSDEKKRQEDLAQQRTELAALKATVGRTQEAQKKKEAAEKAAKELREPGDGGSSTAGKAQDPPPDSAEAEWARIKAVGFTNPSLDKLMEMIGLQSVKREFLSIKDRVDTTIRQQISLANERFSCSLLGNPGTGKSSPYWEPVLTPSLERS